MLTRDSVRREFTLASMARACALVNGPRVEGASMVMSVGCSASIIFRTLRVWKEITDDDVDDECDEGSMAAIAQSVPDSVLMTLAKYETAREAWNALKETRIGGDR